VIAPAKANFIRILVADDHPVFLEGLKHVFQKTESFRVCGYAGSGTEAISKIKSEPYDLLILDVELPGKSGLETLQEVKVLNPSLPVLIVSMYPEEDFALRLLRLGACGYVSKTESLEEIVRASETIVGGGKFINQNLAQQLAREFTTNLEKLPHHHLSNRQFQILCLLAQGKSPKEISRELNLSLPTISTHRAKILAKLNLKSTYQIIHYAWRHGLVK